MFLDKVEGSPSLELVNLVLEMQSRGERVVSLAIGEPFFKTPQKIVEAAERSLIEGDTHYVYSYGLPTLREAIRKKVNSKNRIHSEINNTIFITTKLAVFASLLAASNSEFEALIPDPGYFYEEPVIMSGGKPVRYKLATDFSLDLDELKKKVEEKTKVIIINSPSNPTGKLLDRAQLEELYEFCRERKIIIISDEAYEDVVFEKQNFSVGALEDKPEWTISLFSLSKSYSMTGWRAGYVVASERIVYLINKFIENTLTCFPPFIQKAAVYALENGEDYVREFREEFSKRKKLLDARMQEIDALIPNKVEGAFYAFPRYTTEMNSSSLCKKILQEAGVAILPGIAFGPSGEHRLRLSFSGSQKSINEGMDKLSSFFSQH
jgi:aspartate/methionine/tyrosine aminotransferase